MLIHLLPLLAQAWMPGVSRTSDSVIRANDRFAYVILAETSCAENAQEFEDRARSMLSLYRNKDFVSIEWYSSTLESAIDESRSDVIGDDTFGRWQNLFRSKPPALWGQALKIGTFEGLRRHCNGMKTDHES